MMAEALRSRGAQVEYRLLPGFHGLSYLDQHFADYLRFYAAPR